MMARREYIPECADCRKERRAQLVKHVTKLIRREVSFFNGWAVSESNVDEACEKAATKVLRYLKGGRS